MLKCNVDASFHHNALRIGVGWILRDEHGDFKLAASSCLSQGSNALEAEGMAFLHGLQSVWCRGFRNIIMEIDCKTLIDLLQNHSTMATIDPILVDIRSWADRFNKLSFSLDPRQDNQAADILAKFANSQSITSSIYIHPPRMLRRFLIQDYVNNL